ncbi:hypothetical protein BO82DRAFT_365845 [Aspergillus uvarum CBS 121591]|uniref:Uncharacterized protein n=1 Tax=Aspergillus uvarum CBS 121591 TaxID=1448315 RepID=A0A319C5F7_9EURO|nr:hypothetical protein BO82DRAFT_365845 [Aspergillus uvarum CBS 121591]PYH80485.1 hypothetical protein BO82DRAFT_365845 [Aspergillus uvarum CBS 121591]
MYPIARCTPLNIYTSQRSYFPQLAKLLPTVPSHGHTTSTVINIANNHHEKMSYEALSVLGLAFSYASATPAAYGVCQEGGVAVVMACYSAAGFVWGAALGATIPASIVA